MENCLDLSIWFHIFTVKAPSIQRSVAIDYFVARVLPVRGSCMALCRLL